MSCHERASLVVLKVRVEPNDVAVAQSRVNLDFTPQLVHYACLLLWRKNTQACSFETASTSDATRRCRLAFISFLCMTFIAKMTLLFFSRTLKT